MTRNGTEIILSDICHGASNDHPETKLTLLLKSSYSGQVSKYITERATSLGAGMGCIYDSTLFDRGMPKSS